MTGGILQLVSVGVENMYLTNEPQITFFKVVYRRHTNFSIESMPQYFNIKPDFSNRVSCSIAKNGDLINKIYVVVTLPNIPQQPSNVYARWVENIGYILLKMVEIEIGGKVIDRHYSEWFYIWNELNKTNLQRGTDIMIGNVDELIKFNKTINSYQLYIPLQFWFCRNPALSLPIIALEHSEVKINVEFNEIEKCIIAGPSHMIYLTDSINLFKPFELLQINGSNSYVQYMGFDNSTLKMSYLKIDDNVTLNIGDTLTGIESGYSTTVYDPATKLYTSITSNKEILYLTKSNPNFRSIYNLTISDAYLYVDYVYLDNMERVKFARSDHEYLIDYCQFDNDKIIYNSNNKIKIGYSHPTKEILVRAQLNNMIGTYSSDPFNFTTSFNKAQGKSLTKNITLRLNGFIRENAFDKNFYSYVQAYQHHKSIPPLGLFLYSFALNPTEHQPSGSCNFSKIDDISLDITVEPITYNSPANIRIYAITVNVLRIMNGVAGVAFEN
jgi:hypothetical protein